ncbi:hypothetical protein D5H78_14550 [Vallicoccus soli]|uniref:DUF5666 domain-containing protein n=1 Tax=Vallicoccus soli TaxID=2339232 RepID=A0A3A3YS88_9ACTN|nr:hypothetical protein D5H78_14550 [Vallicoccus soli]
MDAAAGTLTLLVRGGTEKDLRGRTVVVDVPAGVPVLRNDVAAGLADLRVGDEVAVKARRTGTTVVVQRVSAEGPEDVVEPEPEPTVEPTPEPTVEPAPAPEPTVEPEPAPEPTPAP